MLGVGGYGLGRLRVGDSVFGATVGVRCWGLGLRAGCLGLGVGVRV